MEKQPVKGGNDPGVVDPALLQAHISKVDAKFKALQPKRAAKIKEMRKVRELARKGTDFMDLVRKHSDKPEEEADLGWYKRGELMDEFELITFSMDINEISPVFATQWGMHLAKVTDKKHPEQIPIDQVETEISEMINSEHRDLKLKNFINDLRKDAEIVDENSDKSED